MSQQPIIVAPDKFKGSASASEAARALATGILQEHSCALVEEHLIADGGEGTVALLLDQGCARRQSWVTGPLGQQVLAAWAVRGDTAVIEAASACDLHLLPDGPTVDTARNATTDGVGQLIQKAIDSGMTRIVVGVGGTASADGGAGATRHIQSERNLGVLVQVACDVQNSLLGPSETAQVYSPQKGADAATVRVLEERLIGWSQYRRTIDGRSLVDLPGTGAGGGLRGYHARVPIAALHRSEHHEGPSAEGLHLQPRADRGGR